MKLERERERAATVVRYVYIALQIAAASDCTSSKRSEWVVRVGDNIEVMSDKS